MWSGLVSNKKSNKMNSCSTVRTTCVKSRRVSSPSQVSRCSCQAVSCSGVGRVRRVCVYALVCVWVCVMMMMAELVQGQASVAQAGMKADGFTDPFHRARQVHTPACVCRRPHASVCVCVCLMSARLAWVCVCSLLAASAGWAFKLQHTHTLTHTD